jgi:apolipoprotein N-acyltransferase
MTRRVVAAALSGFLLSLAFPLARLDLLAWVAFVPLFWALHRNERSGHAAILGLLFGLSFFSFDVSWIYRTVTLHGKMASFTGVVIFLGMIFTLALFPCFFALCLHWYSRRKLDAVLVAPFLWTGLEYARAIAFTGFPWDLLGYSQLSRLTIVQVSDITGVYGVSFLVMLVNATLWQCWKARIEIQRMPWKPAAFTAVCLIAVLAYGNVRISQFPSPAAEDRGFAIGVLQGNIPQKLKWEPEAREHTFKVYENLATEAVRSGARFLIWPETSVPVLFGGSSPYWRRPFEISEKLGVPMLVGVPSYETRGKRTDYYNTAFLLDDTRVLARYDKIHLVPFGEYMPLTWLLPLGPGLAAREADYSPGTSMTVMSVPGSPPFSVLICYEAIFPELVRMAVRAGAAMLVNMTNDGWFGASSAPYQHLRMATLRAIENRAWMIRCANTGVSVAVDQAGRTVRKLGLDKEGFFVVEIPAAIAAGSFYSRFGDFFAWACIGVCLLLIPRYYTRKEGRHATVS